MQLTTREQAIEAMQGLTDEDFQRFRADVRVEQRRRDDLQAQAELIQDQREAGILPGPEGTEWVMPTDARWNTYMAGDQVTHNGQEWESQVDYNVWEPGGEGVYDNVWKQVEKPTESEPEPEPEPQPEPEPEPEPQPETPTEPEPTPWAPGLQLAAGQRITHNGKTFEVIQAHTTQAGWEPGTPGLDALYKPAN